MYFFTDIMMFTVLEGLWEMCALPRVNHRLRKRNGDYTLSICASASSEYINTKEEEEQQDDWCSVLYIWCHAGVHHFMVSRICCCG